MGAWWGQAQAYWGAFLCGVGLSNQHTLLFYVVVIALVVLWSGVISLPNCYPNLAAITLSVPSSPRPHATLVSSSSPSRYARLVVFALVVPTTR